jgi:nicotinamide-nucleotide adenylyltransferase
MTMIYGALEDLRDRCYIIPLQDVDRNAVWATHVQSMTPAFDLVYSNNPLVVELFAEEGIEVRKPPMYGRESYSGTAIRKLMVEGGDWKNLVPEQVASVIVDIRGVERLVNISRNDISNN